MVIIRGKVAGDFLDIAVQIRRPPALNETPEVFKVNTKLAWQTFFGGLDGNIE